MGNRRNQPLVRQARRCAIGIGMAAAAVVAAGMISIATAATPTTATTCWAKLERI